MSWVSTCGVWVCIRQKFDGFGISGEFSLARSGFCSFVGL